MLVHSRRLPNENKSEIFKVLIIQISLSNYDTSIKKPKKEALSFIERPKVEDLSRLRLDNET